MNSAPYSCRNTRSGNLPRSASISVASRCGFDQLGKFHDACAGLAPLAAHVQVVKPPFPLRRRYQERPPALIDQALGQVCFPDGRTQSRGLVDDEPVQPLPEQAGRVVAGLGAQFGHAAAGVADAERPVGAPLFDHAVADVLEGEVHELAVDLVGQVVRGRHDPAHAALGGLECRRHSLTRGRDRLPPSDAARQHAEARDRTRAPRAVPRAACSLDPRTGPPSGSGAAQEGARVYQATRPSSVFTVCMIARLVSTRRRITT